jgi:hypothetical protein
VFIATASHRVAKLLTRCILRSLGASADAKHAPGITDKRDNSQMRIGLYSQAFSPARSRMHCWSGGRVARGVAWLDGPAVQYFQADPSKTAWMPLVLFVRFVTFQRVVT